MKVAILVNEDTSFRCTGAGCLKAFMNRTDAFEGYPADAELIGFTHVGGELDRKIERFVKNGVDVVHLSSCLRSKYPEYESLANRLSVYFDVVGYSHGGRDGKNRKTVRLKCSGDSGIE